MLEKHSLVKLQSLFAKHIEGGGVSQLGGVLEQLLSHPLIRLHAQPVAVHVTQVDHRIAVLRVTRTAEVFVGLFVAALDDAGNTVQVDRTEIHHRVGVAHLRRLEVASHSQLTVLFDTVSREIAIAYFVLGCSVVALGGFDEVRNSLFGRFLHPKPMLMEDPQIKQCLPTISLHDLRGESGDAVLVNCQFSNHTLEPVNGKVVVVLVLLFHDGGLVHELVGELDLALVVALDRPLIEKLECLLRVTLPQKALGIDQPQVVVGLTEALLLRFRQESDDGLVELIRAGHGLGFALFLRQFGIQQQDCEVITGPRQIIGLGLGVERLRLLLVPLQGEQLLGIAIEIAELVDLAQFGHGLGAIGRDLTQDVVPLLDVRLVLPVTGELAADEAQRESVTRVGLLPSHALLVVPHGLLEVHRQQDALLVHLPQKGTGLRVTAIGLLVVDVQPLDDVLLAVDAEEELVGVVQSVGLSPSGADDLLDDLLIDRLLDLDDLGLGPLLLQQVRDELVVPLRELRTHERLDPVLRLKQRQHPPLPSHNLEKVHRRPKLLRTVGPAAQKFSVLDCHKILANGDQAGVSVLDELPDLGVDFEVQRFLPEDGPHILETLLDGHLMLTEVVGRSLLVLLHIAGEGGQVLVQGDQPPQEVLLSLVDLGPRLRTLLLRTLVVTLLLDLVDATDARDDLVVDRLRCHLRNSYNVQIILGGGVRTVK